MYFDTSNVTCMKSMFFVVNYIKVLGEHFDTSNVTDAWWMFSRCKLPEGFIFEKRSNIYGGRKLSRN